MGNDWQQEPKFAFRSSGLQQPVATWIILGVSLLLTGLAWHFSNKYIHQRAEDRFTFRTQDIEEAIRRRMLAYEQALRGGIGLFAASEVVSRQEWRAYVENARIQQYYPGIQGLGVGVAIRPEEKEAHVRQIRAEGFPNYSIRPEGKRSFYSAVIYLEPFDSRNQRALGYDMYFERVRRKAIDRAIDTGLPTISEMITLVQETTNDVQHGFLYCMPIYQKDRRVETPEQRRAAFFGFIYAPFRAKDLMRGIVGNRAQDVHFEIFDGETPKPEALLYDSTVASPSGEELARGIFVRTATLELSGRKWFLRFESKPNFISAGERNQSLIVAIGGVLVNLLLFFIIWRLSDLRKRAVVLAEQMTTDLARANEGLQQEVAERRRAEAEREKILASVAGTNRELEQFNELAVGRELRMIGLKGEVNELTVAAGREPRYDLSFAESGAGAGRHA